MSAIEATDKVFNIAKNFVATHAADKTLVFHLKAAPDLEDQNSK